MADRLLWTDSMIETAKKILQRHSSMGAAMTAISKELKRSVTVMALDNAFRRRGADTPHSLLKPAAARAPAALAGEEKFSRLVDAIKRGPIGFAELCDKLDLAPKRARELIEKARAAGVMVHVEHDHVGLNLAEPLEKIQTAGIAPTVGKRQTIGHISDTHLGSKYCLRAQLKDFVHHCYYERGIRDITHTGDVLDGDYRHGKFEMTHMGIDEQAGDLFETLPALPGLRYHIIGGNHDWTFTEESGVDTPEFVVNYFRKRGRNDVHAYGNRGAFIKLNGVVIHLWHPGGGGSYARSYQLQKKIEGYTSIKPQILLAGHWHYFCYVEERGIHAIACPTFQAGRSAFGKSLSKGAPSIGGLILSWDLTRDGTMRAFSVEKRSYFEVERPVEIFNHVDGSPVVDAAPRKKTKKAA